jgi:hypothetical protein
MPETSERLMRHSTALIAILASMLLPGAASSAIETRSPGTQARVIPAALSPSTDILTAVDGWRFDGSWYVVLFCPEAAGVHAYAYRFTAAVKDGVLHAERGKPGAGGLITLDGAIQPDGKALLSASGITNDGDEVLGIAPTEKAYAYEVAARFEGSHGLGAGIEGRLCNLHFTRQ